MFLICQPMDWRSNCESHIQHYSNLESQQQLQHHHHQQQQHHQGGMIHPMHHDHGVADSYDSQNASYVAGERYSCQLFYDVMLWVTSKCYLWSMLCRMVLWVICYCELLENVTCEACYAVGCCEILGVVRYVLLWFTLFCEVNYTWCCERLDAGLLRAVLSYVLLWDAWCDVATCC